MKNRVYLLFLLFVCGAVGTAWSVLRISDRKLRVEVEKWVRLHPRKADMFLPSYGQRDHVSLVEDFNKRPFVFRPIAFDKAVALKMADVKRFGKKAFRVMKDEIKQKRARFELEDSLSELVNQVDLVREKELRELRGDKSKLKAVKFEWVSVVHQALKDYLEKKEILIEDLPAIKEKLSDIKSLFSAKWYGREQKRKVLAALKRVEKSLGKYERALGAGGGGWFRSASEAEPFTYFREEVGLGEEESEEEPESSESEMEFVEDEFSGKPEAGRRPRFVTTPLVKTPGTPEQKKQGFGVDEWFGD